MRLSYMPTGLKKLFHPSYLHPAGAGDGNRLQILGAHDTTHTTAPGSTPQTAVNAAVGYLIFPARSDAEHCCRFTDLILDHVLGIIGEIAPDMACIPEFYQIVMNIYVGWFV